MNERRIQKKGLSETETDSLTSKDTSIGSEDYGKGSHGFAQE
tara:strand:+ start:1819 stop:1944 length:126 start_codon:yes stop_codon:yes gene_type:complete